ncbi:hypothetical protein [Occallatibacter riparius]|uniref:Sel1 repeat family protein n=1 Tax=Occallatibacter riparius TaxID=1002689 RepID=A0A9J7BL78_9BACT|nr:hypothetical protein [Occallatibacter riparius]UWZ83209.1 hypothetical protein MOP44_21890 [Occallatibacter riparius]
MKKLVIASVMALASLSLAPAPKVYAQDISIKDPAEYNAFQMFSSQNDPKQKVAAGESFLKQYPQSQVKNLVLDQMIDASQAAQDQASVVKYAGELLQVDPNNLKAILYSVVIKKQQCSAANGSDQATCDDAAAMAQKGLALQKPAAMAQPEWDKLTHAAFPIFHSAIALDDTVKKDSKAAQQEYTTELKSYSEDEAKSTGLNDTLLLAQAYAQPGSSQDLKQAIWFFARVWALAPAQYKAQIEPKLEYYYKKYHGGLDGLDEIKAKAATSVFPTADYNPPPAKSPQEQIHDLIASTPNLDTLALSDKETILGVGSKEDADKMWAVLQGKQTQVPGIVISATADQVQVAVTEDAKASKQADFIVNLKKPLTEAEQKIVQPGFEFKSAPDAMLVGTYDTYKQLPATDTTSASAQVVLKDGEFVPAEKKKATPAHHAPAARRPRH